MNDRQPLALKYRPTLFQDVVGQEAISRSLRNSVKSGRLYPAYLFHGPRGSGKTSMARILARALNCQQRPSGVGQAEPCGKCPPCFEIAQGRSLDVLEMDAASHTQVDNIREVILDTINLVPARDSYRVFIIDEVHMLSGASFNAMLKTLEEPPPHVIFILATTELNKVPATVISRTQSFPFRAFAVEEIVARLGWIAEKEKIAVEEDALLEIARAAGGSLRDGVSILEQLVSLTGEGGVAIQKRDLTSLLGFVEETVIGDLIQALGYDPDFLKASRILREEFLRRGHSPFQLLSSLLRGVSFELQRALTAEGPSANARRLYRLSQHLVKLEGDLRSASDPLLVCEVGLLGFLLDHLPQTSKLIEDNPNRTVEPQVLSCPAPVTVPRPIPIKDNAMTKPAPEPEAQAPAKREGSPLGIGVIIEGQYQAQKFLKFLDLLKGAKLGLYTEGARLEPLAGGNGFEFKVSNSFCLKGLEKAREKVLASWNSVFGQVPLKIGQPATPTGEILAGGDNLPRESQPEKIPEDLEKIAKVFGGKVKRITRM